ncbi:MAG: tripartite tricarboxylate transporter substrate binding protein [Bradyrhizobiaceae bacterium]|nr:tripartite tricarboxylate transporter substrate binding protein [Bradyrhizobiaceae bacterium]
MIRLMATIWFAAVAISAQAADYPARPVRLVIGFGAGGPTDIPARFVADKLGDRLGQRVIVENKPAAAGMIATRDVLSQPRDGYNLLLCTHFEAINTAVYKDTGFKLADIAPVSLIAKYYYGVALSSAIPAADFAAFVEYARTRPGQLNYAVIGVGSAQEIVALQLEKLAGITMNRIPFRGGPQVVQELIAGRVDFYVAPTLALMPQYDSGQLRLLAVTAPARLASAPKVPTLSEVGIDYVRFGWLGFCAAAGTPQDVIDRLNREIVAVVATAEYRGMIEKAGAIAVSSTPDELALIIRQTVDDVAATMREYALPQQP